MKGKPPPMKDESQLKGEGDRFLMDCIQRGDPAAFQQLVERFTGRLAAYATRRAAGTGIDPEDAVQETFLGLLQSMEKDRHRLGEVRSLEAYLFQILRNKIIDLSAKRPEAHGLRRIPIASEDSDGKVKGHEPIASVGSPSSYLQRDEEAQVRIRILADILDEVVSLLKEEKNFRDLKILELLFLSGLKNRDIAALVGTSEPTVTRAKQDALERLARAAARHPLCGRNSALHDDEVHTSDLIRRVWRQNLISCVKRSTLGAYALGTLERGWKDYIAFHLEHVSCETCAANLEDLQTEGKVNRRRAKERVFASSIGFLRLLGGR